jgi:hypothetical protein
VIERVVVGRHAVGRGDLSAQPDGEGLPDLVVEAGLADLVDRRRRPAEGCRACPW